MTAVCFGRAPKKTNPRLLRFDEMRTMLGMEPSEPPDSVDYLSGLPSILGEMQNRLFNDCTCAAYYHARQIWTAVAQGRAVTELDTTVMQLYSLACGYDPANGAPGPTENELDFLTYLMNSGAPISGGIQKIIGFVPVDNTVRSDVKTVIDQCGIAYIGFPVPTNVNYDSLVWDFVPGAPFTDEGHAVVLGAYDANGATAISWGRKYTLTWSFIQTIVDEAYAVIDPSWVEVTGKTPLGMTVAELQDQMAVLGGLPGIR